MSDSDLWPIASSQALIPAPRNMKLLEKSRTPHGLLRSAMGDESWDVDRFHTFKKVMRQFCDDLGLHLASRSETQNAAKWNSLIKKLVDKYEDLNSYQDHWPVAMYFNRWIAERIAKHRQREISPDDAGNEVEEDCKPLGPEIFSPTSSAHHHSIVAREHLRRRDAEEDRSDQILLLKQNHTVKQEVRMPSRAPRYYIGKDPSRFKCPPRTGRCIVSSYSRPVSSANPNAQPSSIFPATYAAQPESSWAYQPTISQPVKTPLGPRNKPINFAMPISVTPTYPRTQPEQPEYGLTTWPVWCVFCQHTTPPTVPACYTADIRRLFPSPSNIPAHLAALGILHDLHLRSFATLPANDQYTFLRSRLTQFQVAEFFDALSKHAKEHRGEKLPRQDMADCPIHKRKDEASAPRALLDVLCSLGMEEVGSIAVSLGIRTDAEFERACQYEEQIKKRFMLNEMGDMRPSAFQKFILEIALRSPA